MKEVQLFQNLILREGPIGLECEHFSFIYSGPGARFSKLPVITGPVKLFCFPFQIRVSKGLEIVQ